MSIEDAAATKVWKFSYISWDKKKLEGIFAASQAEIEWIIGRTIDFGGVLPLGYDTIILMEAEHFTVVSDDANFVELFEENMGASGTTPFKCLDADQVAEFAATFGGSYIRGELIEASKVTALPAFLDEGTRVITFDIDEDLTQSIVEGDFGRNSKELQKEFLSKFEIIPPQTGSVHLSQLVEEHGNGSINCVSVIKRKSDGQLFGYPYTIENGDGAWVEINGAQHGFERANYAHVWFPVQPFTITGYTFS